MHKTIAVQALAIVLLLATAIEPASAARTSTGAGIANSSPRIAQLYDLAMGGSSLTAEAVGLPAPIR